MGKSTISQWPCSKTVRKLPEGSLLTPRIRYFHGDFFLQPFCMVFYMGIFHGDFPWVFLITMATPIFPWWKIAQGEGFEALGLHQRLHFPRRNAMYEGQPIRAGWSLRRSRRGGKTDWFREKTRCFMLVWLIFSGCVNYVLPSSTYVLPLVLP